MHIIYILLYLPPPYIPLIISTAQNVFVPMYVSTYALSFCLCHLSLTLTHTHACIYTQTCQRTKTLISCHL